jgi:hypothetical protein
LRFQDLEVGLRLLTCWAAVQSSGLISTGQCQFHHVLCHYYCPITYLLKSLVLLGSFSHPAAEVQLATEASLVPVAVRQPLMSCHHGKPLLHHCSCWDVSGQPTTVLTSAAGPCPCLITVLAAPLLLVLLLFPSYSQLSCSTNDKNCK